MELPKNPAALSALIAGDAKNFMAAATPGGIERQERAGQGELVNSTNMPIELRPSREAFESVGFKFGDKIDDIFMAAILPAGWKRTASDHAMTSFICDEKGRKRVDVFYKAAFYDRRADANLMRRYAVGAIYPGEGAEGLAEGEVIITVLDAGTEIHRLPAVDRSKQFEGQRDEAKAWMLAKFPNADDPTAYWNDE